MPSLIHYRPCDWARDLAALEALDLSMTVAQVYEVRVESRCFCLHMQDCQPPLEKSYDVDWSELVTSGRCLVATRDERVIGFGALEVTRWNRRATIEHLYVDRASRGHGAGRGLIEELRRLAVAEHARCLWAETQNTNVAAVRFYERCGFGWCGLDTSLYDPALAPNEVALFLMLTLEI